MALKQRFEMTEDQLAKLLDASTHAMWENANRAWRELGVEMGFDAMTAESVPGASQRVFMAVPTDQKSTMTHEQLQDNAETLRRYL